MKILQIIILVYSLSLVIAEKLCEKDIFDTEYNALSDKGVLDTMGVLAIWYPGHAGSHNVSMLCSKRTGLSIERQCFNAIWDARDSGLEFIDCSAVVSTCEEESFEHYYIMNKKLIKNFPNIWPQTKLGEVAVSKEPCLLVTGLPLTRTCIYNATRNVAEWENKDVKDIKCHRSELDIPTLCSKHTGLPIEGECSNNSTAACAIWDAIDRGVELIDCSDIVNKCVAETFEHYYLTNNTVIKNYINAWLPAKLGELSISKDPCLLEIGVPLTRKCIYNATHNVAEWKEKDTRDIKCHSSDLEIPKMCSRHTGQPIEGECSNNRQVACAVWDAVDNGVELIGCSDIVNKCVEETFEHYYLTNNKVIKNYTNAWLPAKLGEQAKSKDICLLETGLPLTRKCIYNAKHNTTEWENKDFKDIKCQQSGIEIPKLCAKHTGRPIEGHCSNNRNSACAIWDAVDRGVEFIDCGDIVNKCVEEPFEHYYLTKNTVVKNDINAWPPAKLGEQATTKEPCWLETGVPLTRKCIYNAIHNVAEWEQTDIGNISCYQSDDEIPKMCSKHTGLPIEGQCSHKGSHADCHIDKGVELIDCSDIVNKCLEEEFEHYILINNNVIKSYVNIWPPAELGERAKSKELCLLETGLPLTRKCNYNPTYNMAEWERKNFRNIKCLWDIKQDIITKDLYSLHKEVKGNIVNGADVATRLTNLLARAETVRIPADLGIATNILEAITAKDKDPALMPKVLQVTNLLMQSDESVILSSTALDTPTTLLKSADKYFDGMANVLMPTSKCHNVPDGVKYYTENLMSVFYINPACSNICGIAVYSTSAHPSSSMHYDRPTNTYFRYLYLNQSLDEILNEPYLEAAGYFPQDVWTALVQEATAGSSSLEAVRFSLYRNGNFFVDLKHNEEAPVSVVLQMSIPGYTDDMPGFVRLIFNHSHTGEEKPQCGYYDAGVSTWNSTGVSDTHVQNVALCRTMRLKSYDSILGHNNRPQVISGFAVLSIILESRHAIISIVGCGLSLLGLMCILLTGMCCKQWRSQPLNMVLLNICLVLTLLMAYFLFINMPETRDSVINMNNFQHCLAEGAFLQYCVLVLFLWMLIVAILQYHQYVTRTIRSKQKIVKFVLAAWGLPLIPTALVVYLDPKSYTSYSEMGEASNAICYPSGGSFYYTMFFPISSIISVNMCILLYIMCTIRRSLKKFQNTRQCRDYIAQLRLSILLFLMLVTAWVFGILAHTEENVVFSLLFCLTSTFLGFILFIYFVIFNKSTRRWWLKYCCCKDYNTLDDHTMTPMKSLIS